MRSGQPQIGYLYGTPKGRTAEVVAFRSIGVTDMLATARPVGTVEVVAFRYMGGTVVHLAPLEEVQDWIRMPQDAWAEEGER